MSVPGAVDDPYALGPAYEATLAPDMRRRAGAHYTPPAVAARLAAIALAGHPGEPTVCDPAMGGGVFLLAAAELLAGRGIPRAKIAEELLSGTDADPGAVAVAQAAMVLWAGGSVDVEAVRTNLTVGDALSAPPDRAADVVLGNPPFLGQLTRDTARTAVDRRRMANRFGDGLGYADSAGLFLLAALDLAADGATVVLLQPESLLAARDARRVRATVLDRAALVGLWVAGEPVFDAAVRVCAPVLRVSETQPRRVKRWRGAGVTSTRSVAAGDGLRSGSWAPLAAGTLGVPRATMPTHGSTVGDLAEAWAGFRQHFYGLVPHVVDGGPGPRLITAGLVDPGVCHWGRRPARFAGRLFDAPSVDAAAAGEETLRWLERQRRPKVVVATQTRVVEAAVDQDGDWVASVPTIAVDCDPTDLWRVAAALLAPPVSAWALEKFGGTALATGAIKLAAGQVLAVPLPRHPAPWDEAAALLATTVRDAADEQEWRAALAEMGELLVRAHGLAAGHAVLPWWLDRLPRWRRVA